MNLRNFDNNERSVSIQGVCVFDMNKGISSNKVNLL